MGAGVSGGENKGGTRLGGVDLVEASSAEFPPPRVGQENVTWGLKSASMILLVQT